MVGQYRVEQYRARPGQVLEPKKGVIRRHIRKLGKAVSGVTDVTLSGQRKGSNVKAQIQPSLSQSTSTDLELLFSLAQQKVRGLHHSVDEGSGPLVAVYLRHRGLPHLQDFVQVPLQALQQAPQ